MTRQLRPHAHQPPEEWACRACFAAGTRRSFGSEEEMQEHVESCEFAIEDDAAEADAEADDFGADSEYRELRERAEREADSDEREY